MNIKQSFRSKFLFLASLVIFTSLFFTPISANEHNVYMSISNHDCTFMITNPESLSDYCADMSFCNTPIALLNSSKLKQVLSLSSSIFMLKYEQGSFEPLTFDPPPPRIFS